ncbi:MAG: IPT/TIG domain-containing protein, partial [Acidobacteria bacterium]|nr:IPT/TIG domain-containing protein [Acidobacteriota bacterium]
MNTAGAGHISEDGSAVLFEAFTSQVHFGPRYYFFDRATGTTRLVGESGWGESPLSLVQRPISADGEWSVIVGRGAANEEGRLYLYERTPALLHPVPIPQGCEDLLPEISADGQRVVFQRHCGTGEEFERHVVAYDRMSGAFTVVPGTRSAKGNISRDGRFVLISSSPDILAGFVDTNGWQEDIFRYDWLTQQVILVNRGASALETTSFGVSLGTAQISDDGGVIGFHSSYAVFGPYVLRVPVGVVQTVPPSYGMTYLEGIALTGDGRTFAFATEKDIVIVDTQTMNGRIVTSTSFPGTTPNGGAHEPVLSRDGSLVAFASRASNLGLGIHDFDREGMFDASLFGVELSSDRVEALSVAGNPSFVQSVGSSPMFLSGNGERAVFHALSNASVLPDRSILEPGPILRDRKTDVAVRLGDSGFALDRSEDGSTAVVQGNEGLFVVRTPGARSPLPGGGNRASVNADGTAVVYVGASQPQGGQSVIELWQSASGQTTRISKTATGGVPNGGSSVPVISADGRFVAFQSRAGDLLPGAPFTAGQENVFVHDVLTGLTQLASGAGGAPADGPSFLESGRVLSRDGRYLLFMTTAHILGGLVLPPGGPHVVLFDRVLGMHTLVSGIPPVGLPEAGLATMDASGRYVVFQRTDAPLYRASRGAVFLFDRATGVLERVSGPSASQVPFELFPMISADGSTIALQARPEGMPPQAYVVDRRTRRVTLASHGADGSVLGNDLSGPAALDGGGDALLFRSAATNLGVDLGYTLGGAMAVNTFFSGGAFLFTAPAIAYSVSPSCASTTGGRTVTIEGAHFKPGSTVTLDGIPATVTNVTSTSITAVTGARAETSARTGHVEVRSPDGEYFALGNAFTYAVRGDANNSGAQTAADGFYLNMALFLGGPQPASLCNGDANGSGATTSADAFFLNLYLF